MLKELYVSGKYKEMDLNCSETVVTVANDAYELGLSSDALRMSSAFGGGMCIEDKCGAVTGALMVIGCLFVSDCAHKAESMKPVVHSFLTNYEINMKSLDCKPLKEMYRTDEYGCRKVIEAALETLEEVVHEYGEYRVR